MSKEDKWLEVPKKDIMDWLGQHIMSSLVIDSWKSKKGAPKKILVKKISTVGRKDGGANLNIDYEAKW